MGINVAVVLFVGIILSAGIIGLCVGSCGFFDWIQAIGNGMSDMFSISMDVRSWYSNHWYCSRIWRS